MPTEAALKQLEGSKMEELTHRAEELSQLMGKVNKALDEENARPRAQAPAPALRTGGSAGRLDPLSQSLPTFPASKGVLVDKYAEIALFDADENQRTINQGLVLEKQKKEFMKKALDEQVRVKQAAALKERAQEREWLLKEQARVKIWNEEEKKKMEVPPPHVKQGPSRLPQPVIRLGRHVCARAHRTLHLATGSLTSRRSRSLNWHGSSRRRPTPRPRSTASAPLSRAPWPRSLRRERRGLSRREGGSRVQRSACSPPPGPVVAAARGCGYPKARGGRDAIVRARTGEPPAPLPHPPASPHALLMSALGPGLGSRTLPTDAAVPCSCVASTKTSSVRRPSRRRSTSGRRRWAARARRLSP